MLWDEVLETGGCFADVVTLLESYCIEKLGREQEDDVKVGVLYCF